MSYYPYGCYPQQCPPQCPPYPCPSPYPLCGPQGFTGATGAQGTFSFNLPINNAVLFYQSGVTGSTDLVFVPSGTVDGSGNAGPALVIGTSSFGPNTAKSFIIDHPLKKDHYLIHACLEGPEAGVYYRGKAQIYDTFAKGSPCFAKGSPCFAKGSPCFVEVELPDYVDALATDFTVHVTPIFDEENDNNGHYKVTEVQNGRFRIYGPPGRVNWIVYGSRGAIEVEPEKSKTTVNGEGPYRWV